MTNRMRFLKGAFKVNINKFLQEWDWSVVYFQVTQMERHLVRELSLKPVKIHCNSQYCRFFFFLLTGNCKISL